MQSEEAIAFFWRDDGILKVILLESFAESFPPFIDDKVDLVVW
jgi:hypothetical protein